MKNLLKYVGTVVGVTLTVVAVDKLVDAMYADVETKTEEEVVDVEVVEEDEKKPIVSKTVAKGILYTSILTVLAKNKFDIGIQWGLRYGGYLFTEAEDPKNMFKCMCDNKEFGRMVMKYAKANFMDNVAHKRVKFSIGKAVD